MRTKMNIVVLAPLGYAIPPKKYGGAERVVYYQIKELAKRGHKITVFCYEYNEILEELDVDIVSGFRKGELLLSHLGSKEPWLKKQDFLMDHTAGNIPSKILHKIIPTLSFTHGMGKPGSGMVVAVPVDQHARWIADGYSYAELVLHTMIEYPNYDKAVIISGDGDLYCLIEHLKKQYKFKKLIIPNRNKYSSLLRKFVQDIAFVSDLRGKLQYK